MWDNDYHISNNSYSIHPLITTGKSDGWILSKFNWNWYITVKSDTITYPIDSLMIRFTFISDSIDSDKEGWMIDDIVTSTAGSELCTGVEDHSVEKKIFVYPNPFSSQTTIKTNFRLNNSQIAVYNSFGYLVYQIKEVSGQIITLPRNGLSPGLYFIMIWEKNKLLATRKVLIVD